MRRRVGFLLGAATLAGVAWLVCQALPVFAVAGLLARAETGTLRDGDLDVPALTANLRAGIEPRLRAWAERQGRQAERLAALQGVLAGVQAVATVPVLLAVPAAPEQVRAAKRIQQSLRPPPLPEAPDPRPLAEAAARHLSTPAGLTALVHAAMARAPEDWPASPWARLVFVADRLVRPAPDRVRLALWPSGVAPFRQARLTVLEFHRPSPWQWQVSGIRLPPDDVHAQVLIQTVGAWPASPISRSTP